MSLSLQNIPSPKEEAWKYTNLRKVMPSGLVPVDEKEIIIHRTRAQNGGEPVKILWSGKEGMYHVPCLKIVLEERAELTLIERHDGQGAYWKNVAVDIKMAPHARLTHLRFFDEGAEGVATLNTHIRQESSSSYNGFYIIQNSKLVRNEVHVELDGENAACELSGVTLLRGKQHGDTTIFMDHKAPHCTSGQSFRTVLNDQARGVFQGKVRVGQAAQKTDAQQLSKALLLSEGAEMDTKPELEIYADDVKCTHGAATGQLDEDALFYLRSRGLPKDAAKSLLIEAFVSEIVDKFADKTVQEICLERIYSWLRV